MAIRRAWGEDRAMSRRAPLPAASLLPRLLARLAEASGKAGGLTPVWAAAVGEHIAKHTVPYTLEGGTLVITVRSAEWARTLEREQASLCERLNAQLGEGVVRTLTFRLHP
jgi:predicted nucleic acid-binding Zn ribbon protein